MHAFIVLRVRIAVPKYVKVIIYVLCTKLSLKYVYLLTQIGNGIHDVPYSDWLQPMRNNSTQKLPTQNQWLNDKFTLTVYCSGKFILFYFCVCCGIVVLVLIFDKRISMLSPPYRHHECSHQPRTNVNKDIEAAMGTKNKQRIVQCSTFA